MEIDYMYAAILRYQFEYKPRIIFFMLVHHTKFL